MARIPDETVDHIRKQSNIVDVVSQYVQLRKSGQNHFAHCPFHEDKTPSFSVNEKKQIFYCFSCGRGGNIFNFLKEVEGLSYPEAIVKAAELTNVELEESIKHQVAYSGPKEDSRRGKLLNIHEKAADFYHHILMNTQIGEEAYNYLIDRGMSKETIKEFQIGFSPPQRSALSLYLENQKDEKYEKVLLRQSGLFSEPREGGEDTFSDRFANRIIFPIRDPQGNTIAFSGRMFIENPDPNFHSAKYINSPETELFNKRRVLFNYDKARATIRREDEVLLFEGFMDVISSWQAGIKNGIASMGTSLTQEQVGSLDRLTDKVVIAYDGDNAGLDATKRAADYFNNETHFAIEIISFPEKLDPDDYIKTKGVEAYKEFLTHGRDTLMTFLMRYHSRGVNLKNESERLNYIDTVLKELTNVSSAIERELHFKQLSEKFDLPIDTLKERFQEYMLETQKERTQQLRKQREEERFSRPAAVQPSFQNKAKTTAVERAEKMLLHRLFYNEEVWVQLQSLDNHFEFTHEAYQTLYILYESYFKDKGEENVEGFLDFINEEELKRKATEIMWMDLGEEMATGEVNDYVDQISNKSPLRSQLEEKKNELKEAERTGDKQKQLSLTIEITNLNRKLKNK